jgi:acyl-CoA synthetase (AMP-forming)/AMP-acid ligase II/acyl carrier protein
MSERRLPALVDALWTRAERTPERVAYEFVSGNGVETLTCEQLRERAAHVASLLSAAGGDRARPALLVYPPGLDYVAALYGCLVAGVPALPAYPPNPAQRLDVGVERLERLIADAEPAFLLAQPEWAPMIAGVSEAAERLRRISVEDWTEAEGAAARASPEPGSSIALLQYTSGSTSDPRGVVVRHRSLEHNIAAIAERFELDEASRGVIWLPPYHDMGLIGGILTPLLVGFPVRLMSPLDFLKSPLAWLRHISETRATSSGGPNFAYDLCVRRRMDEDEIADLDLRSWTLAFNGSEPVRAQTMEAFAKKFEPAGFRRTAFVPCYGLAEATLLVTSCRWNGTAHDGRVSCGPPLGDQQVVVVDPDTGTPRREGDEGEIWLAGPSVTRGYWGRGGGDLFGTIGGKQFLRTGDLGRLLAGELFVSGRLKDVIVHGGRNYHPADVEDAAVAGDERLRPAAAAFAFEEGDETLVAIVVEAYGGAGAAELASAVRRRVLEVTGLRLSTVVVARRGTIPRTSSGKVQRGLCRRRFLEGRYDAFVVDRDDAAAAAPPGEAPDDLVDLVAGVFAAVCSVAGCEPETSLLDIGGDSIRAAEAAAVLERALAIVIPVELVLRALTPAATASRLTELWLRERRSLDELEERLAELAKPAEPAAA